MANNGNNPLARNLDFGKLGLFFVRLGDILVLLMRGSKVKDLRYFQVLELVTEVHLALNEDRVITVFLRALSV
jgi:hypothetical protein